MIAAMILVCSIIATNAKSAARQCSQYVSRSVCCFKFSETGSETDSIRKRAVISGLSKAASEARAVTMHNQDEPDSLSSTTSSVAEVDVQTMNGRPPQKQGFSTSCSNNTKKNVSNQNVESSVVCNCSNFSISLRSRQLSVLKIAANLETHSYGCLLGR